MTSKANATSTTNEQRLRDLSEAAQKIHKLLDRIDDRGFDIEDTVTQRVEVLRNKLGLIRKGDTYQTMADHGYWDDERRFWFHTGEFHQMMVDGLHADIEKIRRELDSSLEPPPQASRPASEDPSTRSLTSSARHAYESFRTAEKHMPSAPATDREAHAWLEQHPEHLDDYNLPAYGTWTRYVRAGRRYCETQKNMPRQGRPHGSSIVKNT